MPRKIKDILCYAAALGNCSDVQSDEHYISKGMFTNNMLTIEGQSWLQGQSKTVSMKKLGLPILCEKHNGLLSPIDIFAKQFAGKLDQLTQISLERHKLKRSSLPPKIVHYVNAALLEQWMIKCAIGGMFENKNLKWHPNNDPAIKPPLKILRALYGYEKLEPPMGLYLTMAKGDTFENMEISGIAHLHHPITDGYVGALINFRNHKFMVWLSDEPLNYNFSGYQSFSTDKVSLFGPDYNQPMFHPLQLNFTGKGKVVGTIYLEWDQEIEKLN